MRIAVSMDGNGHFCLAQMTDREKVIEVLKAAQDGDYLANMTDEIDECLWKAKFIISDHAWDEFISNLTQRGTFEIVEI